MDFETIPAKDLDRLVQDGRTVIVDLRSPDEYRGKHIAGAVNIPYERLEEQFPRDLERRYVLYCERGSVSMAAARELAAHGYRVKTVVGGIHAYRGRAMEGIDVKKKR